jgi:hypothetical protein
MNQILETEQYKIHYKVVTTIAEETGTADKTCTGVAVTELVAPQETETEKVIITEIESRQEILEIPEKIDGITVTGLAKKACFGVRASKIILPKSICEIGDWAFAGCKRLTELWLPASIEAYGRELLLKSDNLKKLVIYPIPCDDGISVLLALSITGMNQYELLKASHIGDGLWYETWDKACMTFLAESDEEGFSPILAGGEEDYISKENDVNYYCHMKRLQKVELCFERLRYDTALAEETKEEYMKYLKEHNCMEEKGEETWCFLRKSEEAADIYYRIFAESGCITEENVDKLVRDLDETETELRAFILRYQNEHLNRIDFFENVEKFLL